MNCEQCGEPSKYKCPTCVKPYCSVPCCKKHKETPCSPPKPVEANDIHTPALQETRAEYEFPTEDTVPYEKFKLLEQSTGLKSCLANPHVRKILEELDRSPQPDALMQECMLEPIFTEFVEECLKVVQPQVEEG